MAEQGSKSGSRAGPRPSTRNAEDDSGDAPEPTYSEARARQSLLARGASQLPSQLDGSARSEPPLADADTKVERRASVRPSAFGAPRKSVPPASAPAADLPAEVSSRHEPHERVLEAARLLDAVAPSLLAAEDSLYAPSDDLADVQRLPNQRARGVEHLVARASGEASFAQEPALFDARSRAGSASHAPTALQHAEAGLGAPSAHASRPPKAGANSASSPAHTGRVNRRPWLSLVLFGGMIALSVVPLLRYSQSSEEDVEASPLPSRTAQPESAAAAVVPLSPLPAGPALTVSRAPSMNSEPGSVGPEPSIADALSEGMRVLEAGDTHEAERVFGHVLELSQDNPRAAYGLSRIRLIQNNLSGAEGWIQLALRKRPRRAAYHAHYAEVLTRMGRMAEAREEQARASANRDSEEP